MKIRFGFEARRSLIRSAIAQSAAVQQRRRVHEALAEVLASDPDRRVWHRAALVRGTAELRKSDLTDRQLLYWAREIDRFQREVLHG